MHVLCVCIKDVTGECLRNIIYLNIHIERVELEGFACTVRTCVYVRTYI